MSYRRSSHRDYQLDGTVVGAIVAALIASVSFGGLIDSTGNLGAIAAFYGLDGIVSDWLFVFAHGFVGAVPFVVALTRAARYRYAPAPIAAALRSPFLGSCLGAAYGVVCWFIVVAVGLPLLIGLTGGDLPLPYRHGGSLLALVGYGAVLGAWYPLARTAVTERIRERYVRP